MVVTEISFFGDSIFLIRRRGKRAWLNAITMKIDIIDYSLVYKVWAIARSSAIVSRIRCFVLFVDGGSQVFLKFDVLQILFDIFMCLG